MSTVTTTPQTTPAAEPTSSLRLSPLHVLRSEWLKFWTVRSTYWTLALTAVVFIGLVTLVSFGLRSSNVTGDQLSGTQMALLPLNAGAQLALIPLAVLGVLTVTSEYSTGMIRASLTAVPTRLPVLWAKAVVVAVVTLVLTLVTVLTSAALASAILHSKGGSLDAGDPQVQRIVLGTALYLATTTLFAFALGALLRHSAAALGVVLTLLLVIENAINVLAQVVWKWLQHVTPFLPASAGSRLTMTEQQITATNDANLYHVHLTAWQGYGVLVVWVVVILAFAAVRLRSRDA
ncbi:ABC transporter permease subunit [Cellulomonas sp. SG140]|uniref:ABC transporter permease subunit n=1 Tax=Cellulomonas sp. SG140 TaxID=2976536 RepID=UPI0021E96C4C|nr:ABC transporter permease subunit [Cellulomonas sp. SG140]